MTKTPEQKVDARLERLVELDPRPELLSFDLEPLVATLEAWLAEQGEPRYRVEQILDAVYRHRVPDWNSMTTLSKELRAALDRAFRFPSIVEEEARLSSDGTRKLLWRLIDGEAVESVLIPTPTRDTFCVSSQAGCALACSFCATGLFGFKRNLTVGEIVDQVRLLLGLRGDPGYGINLVFMGMGEPLLNWENLTTALDILIDPRTLDIGARRI